MHVSDTNYLMFLSHLERSLEPNGKYIGLITYLAVPVDSSVIELGMPDFLLVSYPSPNMAKVISIITEVISHQMRDVTLHCSGIVKLACIGW